MRLLFQEKASLVRPSQTKRDSFARTQLGSFGKGIRIFAHLCERLTLSKLKGLGLPNAPLRTLISEPSGDQAGNKTIRDTKFASGFHRSY